MVWSAEPFASAPQRSVRARPDTTRASTPCVQLRMRRVLIAFAWLSLPLVA